MGNRSKSILCLDFNGVLHSYASGWKGANVFPDPPVIGAMEFLTKATKQFTVHIYSAQSHRTGGIPAMQDWVSAALVLYIGFSARSAHEFVHNELKWPVHKPPAMVTLDDRALQFTGVWPQVSTLLKFKPWNKK
jgi:hypothetical protein